MHRSRIQRQWFCRLGTAGAAQKARALSLIFVAFVGLGVSPAKTNDYDPVIPTSYSQETFKTLPGFIEIKGYYRRVGPLKAERGWAQPARRVVTGTTQTQVVAWKMHIGGSEKGDLGALALTCIKAMEEYNQAQVAEGHPERAVEYKVLAAQFTEPGEYNKPKKNSSNVPTNHKGKLLAIYPPKFEDIPLIYANLKRNMEALDGIEQHYDNPDENSWFNRSIAPGERSLDPAKQLPITVSHGVFSGSDMIFVPAAFRQGNILPHLRDANGEVSSNAADNVYIDDNEYRRGNPDGGVPPWREGEFNALMNSVQAIDRKMDDNDDEEVASRPEGKKKVEPKTRSRFSKLFRRKAKTSKEPVISAPADSRSSSSAEAARPADIRVSSTSSVGRDVRADGPGGNFGLRLRDSLVRVTDPDGRARFHPSTITKMLLAEAPNRGMRQADILAAVLAVATAEAQGRPLPSKQAQTLERAAQVRMGPMEAALQELPHSLQTFTQPDGTVTAQKSGRTNELLTVLRLPPDYDVQVLNAAIGLREADENNTQPVAADSEAFVETQRWAAEQDSDALRLPIQAAEREERGTSSASSSSTRDFRE